MKKILTMLLVLVPVLCFADEKNELEKAINEMFDSVSFKSAEWTDRNIVVSENGTEVAYGKGYHKNRKIAYENNLKNFGGEKQGSAFVMTPAKISMVDLQQKQAVIMEWDLFDLLPDYFSEMVIKLISMMSGSSDKITGYENVNGFNCDVYEYSFKLDTGTESKAEVKVKEWRERKYDISVKAVIITEPHTIAGENNTEKKVGKATVYYDVLSLKINTEVDNSKFEIPEGFKTEYVRLTDREKREIKRNLAKLSNNLQK